MIDNGLRGTLCNKVVLLGAQFVIVVATILVGRRVASTCGGVESRLYNYIHSEHFATVSRITLQRKGEMRISNGDYALRILWPTGLLEVSLARRSFFATA